MRKENLSFRESFYRASDYLSLHPLINSSIHQDSDRLAMPNLRGNKRIHKATVESRNIQLGMISKGFIFSYFIIRAQLSWQGTQVEENIAALEEVKKQQLFILSEASKHYTSQFLSVLLSCYSCLK